MNKLKINLHITQKCNYSCRYCFAHFFNTNDLSVEQWKIIIDNLENSNLINYINFAGGEPCLYKGLLELIDYAKNKGFKTSIITNGSLLLHENIPTKDLFSKIDMLGISVDSFDKNDLIKLGCCTKQKNILEKSQLKEIIYLAKTINPNVKIKLNTVVSYINKNTQLTYIENEIIIDRWKFLKMKLFSNKEFSNKDLLIFDEEFEKFLKLNQRTNGEVIAENSLERSYLIIDNQGNFIDNKNDNYKIIGNLLKENFSNLFSKYQFDRELYKKRY
ncbi:MAG: viperin family antiviral radical SAM protein [Selenomonadaceae bacterium]|jgi:radical S-adenosyl methionine domain-containing protein 2|nr:viperin family antiviral radical SAM protein [Selenomonadaceae bacterium]